MTANYILEISDLTKSYTTKKDKKVTRVLQGISLYVKKGERLGISGSSGCGKTTLLHLIAGLVAPDHGSIIIDNTTVSSNEVHIAPHMRGIGYVFQSPALWPHMTVEQNILYPIQNKDVDIEGLLDAFEISNLMKRYPSQISGGQAKRVAIVRALSASNKLILMDEPLTNLEKNLKMNILQTLDLYIKKTNKTIVYITHDMDELEFIASKKYVLKDGILKNA